MPFVHLIFFPEPRELTDEQVEEARAAGHLREPTPPPPGVRYPVTQVPDQTPVVTPGKPAKAPVTASPKTKEST